MRRSWQPSTGLSGEETRHLVRCAWLDVTDYSLSYTDQKRLERFDKTKVCVLEYPKEGPEVLKTRINEASELKEYLSKEHDDSPTKFRLFVVEDLSRSVIEALGSKFDVDPSFFREHLVDYVWYNISELSYLTPNGHSSGESNQYSAQFG